MTKKIVHYFTLVFCFVWAFLIFIDYWYYHPMYFLSLKNFQYTTLVSVLALVGGGIGYLIIHKIKTIERYFFLFNGIGVVVFLLLISGIIIPLHYNVLKTDIPLKAYEVFTYLGNILMVLSATYFIYLVCHVIGAFFLEKFFNFKLGILETSLVSIALGVSLICILLYILSVFGLLTTPFVWGLFILIPALLWKRTYQFVRWSLFKKFPLSPSLGWLGYSCFYLTLIIVSLLWLQNIRPVPFGFDALALYLNLPKLIYERQGLVVGNSPYYWSLFITTGYFLFNKIEVVISLSVAGGVLSALSLYALSRKWLNRDYSMMTVLLLYSLPLVNFQSYRDVKIDLGLLFMFLAVMILLINYAEIFSKHFDTPSKLKKETNNSSMSVLGGFWTTEVQYMVLMGVLSGVALGIKLTSLILIFCVVASLFFIKTETIGFLTSVTLTLFVILLAGLDVASGIRGYHFGVSWFRWIVLVVGLLGLIFIFYKYRIKSFQLFKLCAIYAFFTALTYMPWPIKNYSETKVISFQTFIEGKRTPAPLVR